MITGTVTNVLTLLVLSSFLDLPTEEIRLRFYQRMRASQGPIIFRVANPKLEADDREETSTACCQSQPPA